MKRLFAITAVAVFAAAVVMVGGTTRGLAAGANNCTTGSTGGTQTCTVHGQISIELGPGCGFPDAFINGNSVFHITINKAGDSWATGTAEGQFLVIGDTGAVVGTGHASTWFGEEDNNQNGVSHFTANGNATLSDGSRIGFHAEGQFTINANGDVTANHTTFDCRVG